MSSPYQENEFSTSGRCSSFCTAESFNMTTLLQDLQANFECQKFQDVIHVHIPNSLADAFFFSYGVCIFWGLHRKKEARFLDHIKNFENTPLLNKESDEFSYVFGENHRIHRDIITLTSKDILPKLAISHGLAQSMKLKALESSVQDTITQTKCIPEDLAKKGKIKLRRKQISKMMGQLFLKRSSVNLDFELLGTPHFFWEHDTWEDLYRLIRNHLDISSRTDVLNQRLKMVHELYEILGTELNHQHSAILELTIIWLIVIEVIISLGKDVFSFI